MELTCGVCNLHTQDEHECRVVWPGQIVADQPAYSLIEGYKAQSKGTSQVGDEEKQDEHASSVLEPVIEIYAGQNRYSDEHSVRDLNTISANPAK